MIMPNKTETFRRCGAEEPCRSETRFSKRYYLHRSTDFLYCTKTLPEENFFNLEKGMPGEDYGWSSKKHLVSPPKTWNVVATPAFNVCEENS